MKFKTTIILALVAIIGAAYVFLYEKKQTTHEERRNIQKKVFFNIDSNSVFKIKMVKNGEPFLFEKRKRSVSGGDYWMLEEPVRTRADKSIINGFLSELEFLQNIRRFDDNEILEDGRQDYGMKNPMFEITFWTGKADNSNNLTGAKGNKEYSFVIGKRVPTGKHVYLQLNKTDDVMVVSDSIAQKLDFDPNGFRDKWVADIDKDAVSKLAITQPGGQIIEAARIEDFWRMAKPVTDRCDNKKIAEIIESLKNLKIEEADFVTDADSNLSMYGLDNPKYRISITQGDYVQNISFGHSMDNKVYAKRDNEKSIFMLENMIVNELSVNPDLLRSRDLVRFETVAGTLGVERVEITTPDGKKLSIIKTDKYDWRITEPIDALADMDVVKKLIEEAKDLRILEFVANKTDDLDRYGLKNPVFNVAIYKKGDKEPTQFFLGNKAEDGGQCYVKRPNEAPIFTITSLGLYEKLVGGLLTFHDKLIQFYDKNTVTKLIIEKNGIEFNLIKKAGKGTNWAMTSPITGIPDSEMTDLIVHSASFLKANRVAAINPEDISKFGLDRPNSKLTICYKDAPHQSETTDSSGEQAQSQPETENKEAASESKTESTTLLIGNQTKPELNSDYFAMTKGGNVVFELASKKVDLIKTELVSKTILRFESAKLKKLTFNYSSPKNEFVFTKNDGNWQSATPELEGMNNRQIEFLVWTLGNLTADEIIEYNINNLVDYGLDKPDLKATVELYDGTRYEVLAKKKKNTDYYYVISSNAECTYTVNQEIIEKFTELNSIAPTAAQEKLPATNIAR